MLRAMDYLCPTDEELRAMTDEELLGPLERPTVDDLAGRYPIMLGEVPLEEAEAWGVLSRYRGHLRLRTPLLHRPGTPHP